jgi:hypothetical protein
LIPGAFELWVNCIFNLYSPAMWFLTGAEGSATVAPGCSGAGCV